MAVDSRDKRSSAVHVSLPWRGMFHVPDGSFDQADRQHIALLYRGILATAVETPASNPTAFWIPAPRPATFVAPPRGVDWSPARR